MSMWRRFEARLLVTALLVFAFAAPAAAFGDGVHSVGSDIQAGQYVAPGGPDCVWGRYGPGAVVRQDGASTRAVIVTVHPDDTAFGSTGCGEWTEWKPGVFARRTSDQQPDATAAPPAAPPAATPQVPVGKFRSKYVKVVDDADWCDEMVEWYEIGGGDAADEVSSACEDYLQDYGWMAKDDADMFGDQYRIPV